MNNLLPELQLYIWTFIKPTPLELSKYPILFTTLQMYYNDRRKFNFLRPTIPHNIYNKIYSTPSFVFSNHLSYESFYQKLHYCSRCGEKTSYISDTIYNTATHGNMIVNNDFNVNCCLLKCYKYV